jgi:kumamolisin
MYRRLKATPVLCVSVLIGAIACLAIWAVPGSSASAPRRADAGAGTNRLILTLALEHQSALEHYLAALDRKGSPEYHHFLTPAQFTARFGASRQQVSEVLTRLRALGYTDSTVSSNRLYLSVKAAAGRRANATGNLRASLGGLIAGVITPAQMPTLTPEISSLRAGASTTRAAGTAPVRAGVDGGSTPCPAAAGAGGYTAPQLASAYDFNGIYAQGFHGEGMSAAVLEFGGFHNGNVTGFFHCYGLQTQVSRVLVEGGAGASAGASETEVALDIEVLTEMAPKLARLYVYEAPNTGPGELGAYNAFVTQDRAPVLSVSWGDCEEGASQSYEQLLATIDEEGAAQGQQIFVASGDAGSKGCASEPLPTGASISADTEASLPWVTGVGGTDLSQGSTQVGATVHREDVWNDGLGAGGGGQSVTWTMPSWQQSYLAATGDKPAGTTNACGAPAGQYCRMVPDIAMNADGEEGGADPTYWNVPKGPKPVQFSGDHDRGSPGYTIYCTSSDCSPGGSGWGRVGGTSAATPLAAAAALLWDQEADSAGVKLGFLNPLLYGIASDATSYARDFHDITGGTDNDAFTDLSCIARCSKLYPAGPGYDMASGLGSVDVANLGTDLVASAGGITLTPASEQMYGYTNGGPTTTAPVSVTAPSSVSADTAFTASSNAGWLVVSPTGSASGSLSWHVDPTGLSAGTYEGQITVTAADHSTATLSVAYTVTPPAKIRLLTRSLHFTEQQVKPMGAKTVKICGAPLWGDELEFRGTLPGLLNVSVPGDEAPSTRRALRLANAGATGSVLHYSIDQTGVSWVSNDLDPKSDPAGVRLKPEQPLVPSVGSLATGRAAAIRLVSLANGNTIGGYPSLQQGTYHGTIVIRDAADPADVVRVPLTLTLGSGAGTPRIGVSSHRLAITAAPGSSKRIVLGLSDPGASCSYGYTTQTSASWLGLSPKRHAGVHHATITVTSLNAAVATVKVPVTLTVS